MIKASRCLRRVAGLACLWLLLCGLSGCGKTPTASASDAVGCVWKVTHPNSRGVLWICGSIHVLRSQDWPLAPAYDEAYRQSTQLTFELPAGAAEGPGMAQSLQRLGFVAADQPLLQKRLSPGVWQQLQQWCQRRGQDIEGYARMRPWLVALMVANGEYAALGAKAALGVERHFEQRAKADGKPMEGLESVEFQLGLFTELSKAEEEELLAQSLSEAASAAEQFSDMLRFWKSGDLKGLHALIHREAQEHPKLFDRLIVQRNRRWATQLMEPLMQGKTTMVLVGAGHMGGEPDGLLALLRAGGCQMQALRVPSPKFGVATP